MPEPDCAGTRGACDLDFVANVRRQLRHVAQKAIGSARFLSDPVVPVRSLQTALHGSVGQPAVPTGELSAPRAKSRVAAVPGPAEVF